MKKKIHPDYNHLEVKCHSCGATFNIGTTSQSLEVYICSQCHPAYTKKQTYVDSSNRIAKFMARQQKTQEKNKPAKTKAKKTKTAKKS